MCTIILNPNKDIRVSKRRKYVYKVVKSTSDPKFFMSLWQDSPYQVGDFRESYADERGIKSRGFPFRACPRYLEFNGGVFHFYTNLKAAFNCQASHQHVSIVKCEIPPGTEYAVNKRECEGVTLKIRIVEEVKLKPQ